MLGHKRNSECGYKCLTLADFSRAEAVYSNVSEFRGSRIGLAGPRPPGVSGDYNGNGVVDMADYVLWRNGGPLQNDPTPVFKPRLRLLAFAVRCDFG